MSPVVTQMMAAQVNPCSINGAIVDMDGSESWCLRANSRHDATLANGYGPSPWERPNQGADRSKWSSTINATECRFCHSALYMDLCQRDVKPH